MRVINIGEVVIGQPREFDIEFDNEFANPYIVRKVTPSCSCMTIIKDNIGYTFPKSKNTEEAGLPYTFSIGASISRKNQGKGSVSVEVILESEVAAEKFINLIIEFDVIKNK